MDENLQNMYIAAMNSYKQGDYLLATESFATLAFTAWLDESGGLDPIDSMEMTIRSFKRLNPKFTLNQESDLIEQYLFVLRHFFDHKEEVDQSIITTELNRKIPNDHSEIRDYIFEEGTVNNQTTTIGTYPVSIITAQGPRDYMEDTHLMLELTVLSTPITIFAVFDGHGGASCAQYTRDVLADILREEIEKRGDLSDQSLYNAINQTFVRINDDWSSLPSQQDGLYDTSGTAALLAVIVDHKDRRDLWVACVGDSRAVLDNDGEAIQLSEDAKPYLEKYFNEIWFRGGAVLGDRVDGGLAMARSIGDIMHPSVSPRPTLVKYTLSQAKTQRLILACDGLWDVVDPELAVSVIQGKNSDEAVLALKDLAFAKGTWDNVTIMLITLTFE